MSVNPQPYHKIDARNRKSHVGRVSQAHTLVTGKKGRKCGSGRILHSGPARGNLWPIWQFTCCAWELSWFLPLTGPYVLRSRTHSSSPCALFYDCLVVITFIATISQPGKTLFYGCLVKDAFCKSPVGCEMIWWWEIVNNWLYLLRSFSLGT